MRTILTSISGVALDTETISVTLPTSSGVITILPGHVPLMSAIIPGIITVRTQDSSKELILGGGVVETNGSEVRILADIIEEGGHDLAEISARKAEAEKLMAEYRAQGDMTSMTALVELEQEYRKDIAREQLARR